MLALAEGWYTAEISLNALHDPKTLAENLEEPYAARIVRQSGSGGSLGLPPISARFSKGKLVEYAGLSVTQLIKKTARRRGLVLLLDEAQTIEVLAQGSAETRAVTTQTVTKIHNGTVGAPVVLLAGGLGITKTRFSSLGISRYWGKGVHNLGVLSSVSAEAVVHDWLVHEGKARSDDPGLETWTRTLAVESQGWPQHLHNYVLPAVAWLLENKGALPAQVPTDVLTEARRDCEAYYGARTSDLDEVAIEVLASFLATMGPGQTLTKAGLVDVLSSDMPEEKARVIFDDFLHKGVLAKRPHPRNDYSVPVPSMHRWLVESYANGQSKRAIAPPQVSSVARSQAKSGTTDRRQGQ